MCGWHEPSHVVYAQVECTTQRRRIGTNGGSENARTERARVIERAFYARPTLEVARGLIGKTLWRRTIDGDTAGIVVEAEAYCSLVDPASHGYRGRTARNRTMFGPPGHAYVYRSYGLHYCVNVVTEEEKVAAAVLIRALEPTVGLALMRARRGPAIADRDLARGPGRVCQALAITLADNGADLLGPFLWLSETPGFSVGPSIAVTPRVGITRATELPWRFVLVGSPFVSHRLVRRVERDEEAVQDAG
jgi:DNA-3-methyladenine glycosylase